MIYDIFFKLAPTIFVLAFILEWFKPEDARLYHNRWTNSSIYALLITAAGVIGALIGNYLCGGDPWWYR